MPMPTPRLKRSSAHVSTPPPSATARLKPKPQRLLRRPRPRRQFSARPPREPPRLKPQRPTSLARRRRTLRTCLRNLPGLLLCACRPPARLSVCLPAGLGSQPRGLRPVPRLLTCSGPRRGPAYLFSFPSLASLLAPQAAFPRPCLTSRRLPTLRLTMQTPAPALPVPGPELGKAGKATGRPAASLRRGDARGNPGLIPASKAIRSV